MIKINTLIATFLKIGYAKHLPGTLASFVSGLFIYIFLIKTNPTALTQLTILLILLITAFLSIKKYQKTSKEKDPKEIVIDEVVGMYISLIFLNLIKTNPYTTIGSEIDYFLLSFVLFRLFDGFKPSFLYRIQIRESDASILLDDIFSGILTFILMLILASNNFI